MHWPVNTLPAYIEMDVHSLSGLLWTLALLFLWHCYRIGSDMPMPGHIHAGKLKSGSRRSMMSRGGGCGATKCSSRSKLSRGDQMSPFISMKTEEDEERGQDYLAPVLGQSLFPAQATAEARKRYAALQEYAKRYSWVGMGRIHKGLREQLQVRTLWLNLMSNKPIILLRDCPVMLYGECCFQLGLPSLLSVHQIKKPWTLDRKIFAGHHLMTFFPPHSLHTDETEWSFCSTEAPSLLPARRPQRSFLPTWRSQTRHRGPGSKLPCNTGWV